MLVPGTWNTMDLQGKKALPCASARSVMAAALLVLDPSLNAV